MNDFNDMVWSFTRLDSFATCPYEWYLHYVEGNRHEGGFFGEFGTLVHTGIQKILDGTLSIFEAQKWYEDNWNQVIMHDAPGNAYVDLGEKYYKDGLAYFGNIAEMSEEYEILGIEKKVDFQIDGRPFVGFIDLLLRNKNTDAIIICDHKTATLKFKKNGEISKTDAEHFKGFKRQLYLYAKPVIASYAHVDYLAWNMVRMGQVIKIPFRNDEYEDSLNWAKEKIKEIESETLWLPKKDEFYCKNLCCVRDLCEFNEWKEQESTPSPDDFYGHGE